MNTFLSIFHALSPLHAGVGQGIGTIDLPIAREKSTNIPYVPGSSLKGVLRERCQHDKEVQAALFGPESDASDFAGSVYFSDLTLLCLPVRSLQQVFAWVTSPYILRRFQRDHAPFRKLKVPAPKEHGAAIATEALRQDKKVFLEELDLEAETGAEAKAWGEQLAGLVFPDPEDAQWKPAFVDQFCICHDNVFSYLMEHGTEVTARIRLNSETKTVARGALWYEESLPVESLLWGLIQCDTPKGGKLDVQSESELRNLVSRPIQIGGKASVGRGLGWLKLHATGGN